MKAVIVGCGRVGAGLADELDRAGWQVLIIDRVTAAFDRLPSSFGGTALRGDGTDEDTLRRAGAEGADLFLALTEGDNRNIMAAQLGLEALGARSHDGQVQRPSARRGLRPPRDRHGVPDQPDDDRHPGAPGPGGARPGRHLPPDGPPRSRSRRDGRRERRHSRRIRQGGLSDVRAGRGWRQGRVLPDQGADRVGARGRPDGEGPGSRGTDPRRDRVGGDRAGRVRGQVPPRGRGEPGGHRGRGHRRRRGQPGHLPDGEAPLRRAGGRSPGSTTRRTRRCSGTSAWTRSSAPRG